MERQATLAVIILSVLNGTEPWRPSLIWNVMSKMPKCGSFSLLLPDQQRSTTIATSNIHTSTSREMAFLFGCPLSSVQGDKRKQEGCLEVWNLYFFKLGRSTSFVVIFATNDDREKNSTKWIVDQWEDKEHSEETFKGWIFFKSASWTCSISTKWTNFWMKKRNSPTGKNVEMVVNGTRVHIGSYLRRYSINVSNKGRIQS